MGFYLRCFFIVLLSPVLALATAVVYPGSLVMIPFGYPLIVVVAGLLMAPFHWYIKYGAPPRYAQITAATLVGAVVGIVLTYYMLRDSSFSSSNDFFDIAETVWPLMAIGVGEALAMWVLYTFGPFKIAGTESSTA